MMKPPPKQVESRLRQGVESLLERGLQEFYFSGYQCIAVCRGQEEKYLGGVTSYWPDATRVDEDTYFDIGSLTKLTLTTSLFARAIDAKELGVSAKISKWIPELSSHPIGKLSIGDFLSHSSGLVGWYPLYRESGNDSFLQWFTKNIAILGTTPPRTKSIYSDIGFLLLGVVLERMYGSLNSIFQERVLAPLGITEMRFGPMADKRKVAATEYRIDQNCILQGEVFDENCAAMGGVAAHAGLFATARALSTWANEWLRAFEGKSSWLSQDVAIQFTKKANFVPGSTWALGWDTKSPEYSSCGTYFSMQSFGWLGYPGCSVWIDPKVQGFVVLLTNRVHPTRLDERIRRIRPLLHDEIAKGWQTFYA